MYNLLSNRTRRVLILKMDDYKSLTWAKFNLFNLSSVFKIIFYIKKSSKLALDDYQKQHQDNILSTEYLTVMSL